MSLSLRVLQEYGARFSGLPNRWRVLMGVMVAATVLTLLDVRAALDRPNKERGRACGLDNEVRRSRWWFWLRGRTVEKGGEEPRGEATRRERVGRP